MELSSAILCLAMNVYFEARGESDRGKYAVAHVTLNRVKENKTSVCKEVFRYKQFSWTEKYKIPNKNEKAWIDAIKIAKTASQQRDPTEGSTYFFNSKKCKNTRTIVSGRVLKTKIGPHVFYSNR